MEQQPEQPTEFGATTRRAARLDRIQEELSGNFKPDRMQEETNGNFKPDRMQERSEKFEPNRMQEMRRQILGSAPVHLQILSGEAVQTRILNSKAPQTQEFEPERLREKSEKFGPGRRPEAAAAASSLQSADAEIRCEAIEEPGRKRRCVVPEAVVSPFFSLRPYASHKPAFVGRSLWCLDCFEVPGSAHRSWRHGRCGGPKPPMTMPPALRDGIFRQSAACPKLQACTRSRWTVLAGALGLQ